MKLLSKIVIIALTLFVSMPFMNAQSNTTLQSKDLLGQWRVSELYFQEIPTDSLNKFSSFHMNQGIVRYDFKNNDEFTFIVPKKKKNKPEDGKYWNWSFDKQNQNIVINQISLSSPPFNFGLTAKIIEVYKYQNYTTLLLEVKFHADNNSAKILLTNNKDQYWDNEPKVFINNKNI
ncbi:hypothetical protein [Myroides injenensis]|uniref:hypothetical protein n=1 Tax=Myroides injenensis TaxID=1183151 RepID=UPI0002899B48|nr:hypothetical protein [Myroides injenensis]